MEKIFAKETTDKGLISKICKHNSISKNKQLNQQMGGRPKKTLLQRHIDGQQIHENMLNITLEKCKSKLQRDTTSHRSEWPSSKSQQIINAGEEKRIFLHCWWECKLDKTTMVNSMGVP